MYVQVYRIVTKISLKKVKSTTETSGQHVSFCSLIIVVKI